jgi:hypothetical protein
MSEPAKFSPEWRERLGDKVAPLNVAIASLNEHIKPVTAAIAALKEQIDGILRSFGITESYDDIETCESCQAFVLEGDLAHRCLDGPTLCVECAPTWSDMEKQVLEQIEDGKADPSSLDEDDGGIEALEVSLASVRAHIAAGDGDKKHVW